MKISTLVWVLCGGVFGLVVCVGLMALPSRVAARGQTVADFWQATVRIRTDRGYGTGFEGTYQRTSGPRATVIVTAAHVIRGAAVVSAVYEGEGVQVVRPLRVLREDSVSDLALLVADAPTPGVQFFPDLTPEAAVSLGEPVWYAGFGADTRNWLEQSIVARPVWVEGGYRGFVTTGKGWYGNSGSAVVVMRNGQARLAGVLCCSAASERGSSEVHAFAPSGCQGGKAIRQLLDKWTP